MVSNGIQWYPMVSGTKFVELGKLSLPHLFSITYERNSCFKLVMDFSQVNNFRG